jgi:hypothetical protein
MTNELLDSKIYMAYFDGHERDEFERGCDIPVLFTGWVKDEKLSTKNFTILRRGDDLFCDFIDVILERRIKRPSGELIPIETVRDMVNAGFPVNCPLCNTVHQIRGEQE